MTIPARKSTASVGVAPCEGRNISSAAARVNAFTLLEMLLVLAILVAITAVTIPVVERMYDTHRIQHAATEVRNTLGAARLRAVDRGESMVCRLENDGRQLVVVPQPSGLRFGDDPQRPVGTESDEDQEIHLELIEPLVFWIPEDARLPVASERPESYRDGAARSWSAPIVFAPNGTSTDAAFEIRDPSGRAVHVEIRGLTGATSASTLIRRSVE